MDNDHLMKNARHDEDLNDTLQELDFNGTFIDPDREKGVSSNQVEPDDHRHDKIAQHIASQNSQVTTHNDNEDEDEDDSDDDDDENDSDDEKGNRYDNHKNHKNSAIGDNHNNDNNNDAKIDLLATLENHTSMINNDANKSQMQLFVESWFHVGNISNIISGGIFLLGLILRLSLGDSNIFGNYVLSLGLFAFAGGITNWLAVKMLFDKIPYLYGSGVIPRRFVEIRIAVKQIFMHNFFDEVYLQEYLNKRLDDLNIEGKLVEFCDSPQMSDIIDEQLKKLSTNPLLTMMLAASGMANANNLLPMMKPFIITMAKDFIPELKNQLMSKDNLGSFLDVSNFRDEMDKMLDDRLQYLDDKAVKRLMEHVIRRHLYWLIVWGNVFGGLIGLVSAIFNLP